MLLLLLFAGEVRLPQPVFSRKGTKGKQKAKKISGTGKRVEVKYDDGVWYKGTLTDFDITTGQWEVEFDKDEGTASISFPDEDVRLL